MCEYQTFNPNDDNSLPICEVNNELCTLCVLGNAKTYEEAQAKLKEGGKS